MNTFSIDMICTLESGRIRIRGYVQDWTLAFALKKFCASQQVDNSEVEQANIVRVSGDPDYLNNMDPADKVTNWTLAK